jgi:hypothetical protein
MLKQWLGINWIKLTVAAVLVLGVGVSAYSFWSNYRQVLATNAELSAALEAERVKVQVQGATIDAQADALREWEAFRSQVGTRLQELADGQQQARDEQRRLVRLFDEHDLQALLDARPGLVLDRVNRGTDRALRMLECASGASGPGCDGGRAEAVVTVGPETGVD